MSPSDFVYNSYTTKHETFQLTHGRYSHLHLIGWLGSGFSLGPGSTLYQWKTWCPKHAKKGGKHWRLRDDVEHEQYAIKVFKIYDF